MSDEESQAQELFDALRSVDELGVKTVYAHCPKATEGVGMALYNRLIRAAAFRGHRPARLSVSSGLRVRRARARARSRVCSPKSGLPVVSADKAAREAVEDESVKAMLCEAFGDILLPDGSLDRRRTAEIAFSTPENTERLNSITHPKISELMLEEAESARGDTVVFDASQLFEAGEDLFCDLIVGVVADPRDKDTSAHGARRPERREEVERRMSAQLSEEFFIASL